MVTICDMSRARVKDKKDQTIARVHSRKNFEFN